jgi:hypothetical protein
MAAAKLRTMRENFILDSGFEATIMEFDKG